MNASEEQQEKNSFVARGEVMAEYQYYTAVVKFQIPVVI